MAIRSILQHTMSFVAKRVTDPEYKYSTWLILTIQLPQYNVGHTTILPFQFISR